MHFHKAAYNVLYFGYKKWTLTSPDNAALSGLVVTDFLRYANEHGLSHLTCLQRPGDLMFIPAFTGHATLCDQGFCTGIGNLINEPEFDKFFAHEDGKAPVSERHPQPSWFNGFLLSQQSNHTSVRRDQDTCPNIAFVHINKVGGTSMNDLLKEQVHERMLSSVTLESKGKPPKHPLAKDFWFHATASRQRDWVGAQLWKSSYTFAIVRNPWARQLSMFNYVLPFLQRCEKNHDKSPKCEQHRYRMVPNIAHDKLHDTEFIAIEFRKWINKISIKFPLGSPEEYLFGTNSHGNEIEPQLNATQMSYLVDADGALLVDEIFRLEDMNQRWPYIRQKLCLGENVVLPHENSRPHAHYSVYYDQKSIDIVGRYMQADIAAFDYKFETEVTEKR